jgi:hypothetical protein
MLFLPFVETKTRYPRQRDGQFFLINLIDGIRSVKVSGKKVNVALDKELRQR